MNVLFFNDKRGFAICIPFFFVFFSHLACSYQQKVLYLGVVNN